MRAERIGDWDKVARLIKAFKQEWEESRKIALMRWGLKAEGTAKKHISLQDLGWKPLKAETIARKVSKGYSENILVQSSDYFQAITSWVDEKQGAVFVGVRKNTIGSDGQSVESIAAVHEYGSKSGSIPARPLWQPTMDETMKWFQKSSSRPDVIFMAKIKSYL